MHVNDINDHTSHKINILLYADNLVVITNTRLDFQKKLIDYISIVLKKCLSVNIKKTKIINSSNSTGSFRFSTDTLLGLIRLIPQSARPSRCKH